MLSAGSKSAQPITQAAAREIQAVLGDHLQATLVESSDPLWTPDARCERMSVDYRTALAKLVPVFMPELLFRLNPDGSPVFPDFAKSIERTEFAPGIFHGQGAMRPIDYLVALADLRIEPPSNLDISTVQQQILANTFRFHISQYLSRRAEDWAERGMTETVPPFGVTTTAQPSKIGKTCGTRATRWGAAKVSMSASCCVSCFVGWT
jgi:hypothetical protein